MPFLCSVGINLVNHVLVNMQNPFFWFTMNGNIKVADCRPPGEITKKKWNTFSEKSLDERPLNLPRKDPATGAFLWNFEIFENSSIWKQPIEEFYRKICS